ncbi:MAG: YdcH family protein [Alphaproteobacteria bacterium]|nr:YdcH family protein [Alphaproteobacteria bacterium]
MNDQEELEQKLAEYKTEHQALDDVIDRIMNSGQPVNLLEIQQLKKKKLWLRDMIQKLQSALIDDIIA